MTRVQHCCDQVTSTSTYVVSDAETAVAAIIDPVLDLDYASGTLAHDPQMKSLSTSETTTSACATSSKPTFTPTISPARPTFVSSSVERL